MSEEIETLGAYLRRERKKRDISVEQIAYATRISLKMLTALEEDRHLELPAQPFVRGYLQAYAKYVRLDPKDVILRYQHHLATQPGLQQAMPRASFETEQEDGGERQKILWVTAGLVGVLLASGIYVWVRARLNNAEQMQANRPPILKTILPTGSTPPTNVVSTTALVGTEAPANASTAKGLDAVLTESKRLTAGVNPPAAPAAKPAATPTAPEAAAKPATPPPAPATTTSHPPAQPSAAATTTAAVAAATPAPANDTPKKYNLSLKAKEDVWLRLQADNEEVKDFILRKDKAVMIRANKMVKVFSGNIKALVGTLNGTQLESLTSGDWKRSAVIPASEVPNVKLPLFPGSEGSTEAKPGENKTNSEASGAAKTE